MEINNLLIALSFLQICLLFKKLREKKKRNRRWGVRPINKDWVTSGYHKKVFIKMKHMDEEQFFKHTRMTRRLYDLLLAMIQESLTNPKQRIGPEERLSITLLHLAHASSIQSIAWSYKLGKTTVRNIILETCSVIWKVLSPIYVSEPSTQQYIDIENDFSRLWNMPNCVGAIDGKHIAIKCPPLSGSAFHNYKKFFSIVLMAVCDANYTFTGISIGSYGSQSDGGIFRLSPFGEAVMNQTIPVPTDKRLSPSSSMFPHYFVGDAAFPLRPNLMRPYAGTNLNTTKTIFNYRLSRARRVIENSFGILSARWRILLSTIECNPENCETVVLACIALHNFIMLNDHNRWYCPPNYTDREDADGTIIEGDWRIDITPLRSTSTYSRRPSELSIQLRDVLAHYFENEGAIPFQYRML